MPGDPHQHKKYVFSFVRTNPECTVREVADALFDGCLSLAHATLNSMYNAAALDRKDDRYTVTNLGDEVRKKFPGARLHPAGWLKLRRLRRGNPDLDLKKTLHDMGADDLARNRALAEKLRRRR